LLNICREVKLCITGLLLFCREVKYGVTGLLLFCREVKYGVTGLLLFCREAKLCITGLLLFCREVKYGVTGLLLFSREVKYGVTGSGEMVAAGDGAGSLVSAAAQDGHWHAHRTLPKHVPGTPHQGSLSRVGSPCSRYATPGFSITCREPLFQVRHTRVLYHV